MKDIVIVGCGGMGREVAWLIEDINNEKSEWNILGYVDDDITKHGKVLSGYKVIGNLECLRNRENIYYVCAIGNPRIKKILTARCNWCGYTPATLIHPTAKMSKSIKVGNGSIIAMNSIITIDSIIEEHVIINLNCTIAHDVHVGKYGTILSNVNISGNVDLDEGVLIGTNTAVIQGIRVGRNTTIGAGAVVVRDIPANATAVGVPARVIKMENA